MCETNNDDLRSSFRGFLKYVLSTTLIAAVISVVGANVIMRNQMEISRKQTLSDAKITTQREFMNMLASLSSSQSNLLDKLSNVAVAFHDGKDEKILMAVHEYSESYYLFGSDLNKLMMFGPTLAATFGDEVFNSFNAATDLVGTNEPNSVPLPPKPDAMRLVRALSSKEERADGFTVVALAYLSSKEGKPYLMPLFGDTAQLITADIRRELGLPIMQIQFTNREAQLPPVKSIEKPQRGQQ